MKRKIKIVLIFLLISLTIFLLWSRNSYNNLFEDYFRLSENEVLNLSQEIKDVSCKKIKDCDLLPGDILIRRYVTERTQLLDDFFKPYYMHASIYLGENQYFEALGFLEEKVDQIQVMEFENSDWMNEDLENFVIIRPKNYGDNLENVLQRFKEIADDPEYIFGMSKKPGDKKTTCADIIVKTLQEKDIFVRKENEPKIISPDYLFFITISDKENFEIVGYN